MTQDARRPWGIDDLEYLIWSFEHNRWWLPARWGYTTNVEAAGRYSFDEALEITANANLTGLNEAMVPLHPDWPPRPRP